MTEQSKGKKINALEWCPGPESNQRHADFQAKANDLISKPYALVGVKPVSEHQGLSCDLSNQSEAGRANKNPAGTAIATGLSLENLRRGAWSHHNIEGDSSATRNIHSGRRIWSIDANLVVIAFAALDGVTA